MNYKLLVSIILYPLNRVLILKHQRPSLYYKSCYLDPVTTSILKQWGVQSAYKKGHSNQTALTKVCNGILRALADQKVVLLTLLDTVNDTFILIQLEHKLGISSGAIFHISPREKTSKLQLTYVFKNKILFAVIWTSRFNFGCIFVQSLYHCTWQITKDTSSSIYMLMIHR